MDSSSRDCSRLIQIFENLTSECIRPGCRDLNRLLLPCTVSLYVVLERQAVKGRHLSEYERVIPLVLIERSNLLLLGSSGHVSVR